MEETSALLIRQADGARGRRMGPEAGRVVHRLVKRWQQGYLRAARQQHFVEGHWFASDETDLDFVGKQKPLLPLKQPCRVNRFRNSYVVLRRSYRNPLCSMCTQVRLWRSPALLLFLNFNKPDPPFCPAFNATRTSQYQPHSANVEVPLYFARSFLPMAYPRCLGFIPSVSPHW